MLAGHVAEARFRKARPDVKGQEPEEWAEALKLCAAAGLEIEKLMDSSRTLVDRHWHVISALADLLDRKGDLSGDLATEFIRSRLL